MASGGYLRSLDFGAERPAGDLVGTGTPAPNTRFPAPPLMSPFGIRSASVMTSRGGGDFGFIVVTCPEHCTLLANGCAGGCRRGIMKFCSEFTRLPRARLNRPGINPRPWGQNRVVRTGPGPGAGRLRPTPSAALFPVVAVHLEQLPLEGRARDPQLTRRPPLVAVHPVQDGANVAVNRVLQQHRLTARGRHRHRRRNGDVWQRTIVAARAAPQPG